MTPISWRTRPETAADLAAVRRVLRALVLKDGPDGVPSGIIRYAPPLGV
jgi:hypothetical protein